MYKTKIPAFKNFRAEWGRVKKLYLVSMFSYEEVASRTNYDINNKLVRLDETIEYKGVRVANSPREFVNNLNGRYANMLRDSLFVRLVSIMELYFSDVLLEVSKITFSPFKSPDTKELKVAQILEIKDIKEIQEEIIQNKIRGIVLGGLSSISKFFKKNLKIDFNESSINLRKVEELYSRRNLIVHAGGVTDQYYFDKYPNENLVVGKASNISEEYLLESLEVVFELIQFISISLEQKHDFSTLKKNKSEDSKINDIKVFTAHVVCKNNNFLEKLISDEYVFGFQEKYKLKEIIINKNVINKNEGLITVKGDKIKTGTYRGFLKMLKRTGLLTELSIEQIVE